MTKFNKEEDIKLQKQIRCKCGKYWGLKFFRLQKVCKRCKTKVIARGKRK